MKKFNLLVAAFAAMASVGTYAQGVDWTPSVPSTDRAFVLYNCGAQAFLVGGNNWGTRASVSTVGGLQWNLTTDGSGYRFQSPTYASNLQLGSNGYVDNGDAAYYWTLESTTFEGKQAYRLLTTDGNILYADNAPTSEYAPATTTVGADPGTNMDVWMLVEPASILKVATAENPVDATFLINNPNFSRAAQQTLWTVVANNSNLAGGNNENMCAESWQSTFNVYQTINVPNGVYAVTAQGAITEYTVEGTNFPVVYITGDNTQSVSFTTMTGGENSMALMSTSFSNGSYQLDWSETVNVVAGSVTVGVQGTRTNTWACWDNIKLMYYGPVQDLTPYIEAYESALADANDLVASGSTMSATALSILTQAARDYASVDETSQEALEEATTVLLTAIAYAQTSISSYAIIAQGSVSNSSLEGWTCTNSNTFHINTWSVEGNSDGSNMKTPFIENWVGKGSFLGAGEIYYQLEGLEPGESYYVSALVRSYNEASSDAPNGPTFFINDVEQDMSEVGVTFTYNEMSGIYANFAEGATVDQAGVLKIGVRIDSERNYNWVAFKDVKIMSFDDKLAEAVAAAEAVSEQLPASLAAGLVEAIQEYNKSYDSVEGYLEAIANIESTTAEFQAMIDPYNVLQAYVTAARAIYNVNYVELEQGAHETFGTVLDEVESNTISSADDITNLTQQVYDAVFNYVENADPAGDELFDITEFYLTNADVTDFWTGAWWVTPEGWYTDNEGNFQVMANDAMGPDGEVFYEFWSNTAASSGFVLYQQATLPAGTYEMTGRVGLQQYDDNGTNANVTFSANEIDGSRIAFGTLQDASVKFVNSETQNVKIGLKAQSGNNARWMAINKIKLYKAAASEFTLNENETFEPVSDAGDVTLTRTLVADQWNTLVLPFSVTADEIAEYFGEGVLVANFVEVPATDETEVSVDFETMEAPAIQANVPVLIKPSQVSQDNVYEFPARTLGTGDPIVSSGTFSFVGTYDAETVIGEGNYFFSGASYYKATAATRPMKAFRAYIQVAEGAELKGISIDGKAVEDATAINGLQIEKTNDGAIYNIQGQRVSKAVKGIYIQNGKKVYVK